ncbi:type II toxin-antitoxin system VapB family antitoxin [Spirosoma sp. KCTC 42546]|uniref:type II toxin-antitoxin system VapB family antitoxin n=1 Tax=Spirosoma sp. KCTC 42546 TaxID=2520506 RepID=UPI0011584E77|nr:type II toxin-antitoxin system VapB family antitoxin [Spirosoma sp. KCTC 42546]QDK81345.1 type II toxin-antitoxin system VapB family antitoxin [Spirosoma sp. KCTC 42546]
MRTNIDINDELLQVAMEISHLKTKKAIVELALQEYINMMRRKDLLSLRGKVQWDGDLDQMRTDNTPTDWDK